MRISPILLKADNFTPPIRTPWGGKKILNKYKASLQLSHPAIDGDVIGESWELSVEPDFPSLTQDNIPLIDILASNPIAMLGEEAMKGRNATALLLKILDSNENLSVQIHPHNTYSGLNAGETGKTECWYIIDHEPGAGIYLGFQPHVDQTKIRNVLEFQADMSKLLYFIPVSCGDLFIIEPGTPHTLGKGITLLEPQYVVPGRRGITYRYWDWNRLYDDSGKQTDRGKPRQIHLEHALKVTNWDRSRGNLLQSTNHMAFGPAITSKPATIEYLCGPGTISGMRCDCLQAARIVGSGHVQLPNWNVLRALTVLEGEVILGQKGHEVKISIGQTVAIPASLKNLTTTLNCSHSFICAVHESSANLDNNPS